MKLFLLFLSFLFLWSCSDEVKRNEDQKLTLKEGSKYMSQMAIKQSFAEIGTQKAGPEYLNEKALAILRNTTPVEKFFTAKQLAKKKTKKQKYNGKGFVDLREFDSPVESQWNGTCSAHGLKNAIDNLARTQVSTRHVWSGYQQYLCEAAINTWMNGSCITSTTKWPHENTSPNKDYKDSKYCSTYLKLATYIEDDLDKMKESLDNGKPVYLGISVTNSMANCDSVLTATSKSTKGGHALAIVGYKDDANVKGGGYFTVKNSWGSDCADNGYQYVPYYYCKRKDMYCMMWTIDKVDINSSAPTKPSTPESGDECLKYKRVWYAPWRSICVEYKEKINVLMAD